MMGTGALPFHHHLTVDFDPEPEVKGQAVQKFDSCIMLHATSRSTAYQSPIVVDVLGSGEYSTTGVRESCI